jgi:hypothetical protein
VTRTQSVNQSVTAVAPSVVRHSRRNELAGTGAIVNQPSSSISPVRGNPSAHCISMLPRRGGTTWPCSSSPLTCKALPYVALVTEP